ncbi:helix-turn-helix domain-containing protein [Candidatus Williamhamiltonella defendens]|uniref:helix-turn-helix domain-containing protein n=1 Tax=Candidatus Williamhamiltonella defendens TaxID=138072 RepID=UPI00130EE82A|nr:helix-turn-helix domain-containing protein [Candidatus Hamiltonella defensa]
MKPRCIEHKIPIETIRASLKKTREASKLTQQTVADRLCLRLSTIQKIEKIILRPIFSAFELGYIRSYARLLNLLGEALLSKLNEEI